MYIHIYTYVYIYIFKYISLYDLFYVLNEIMIYRHVGLIIINLLPHFQHLFPGIQVFYSENICWNSISSN